RGADLEAAFRIEKLLDAKPRGYSRMETALRADHQILLEIGPVEHGLARDAFDPQTFGHRRLAHARRAFDTGWQKFGEPAHAGSETIFVDGVIEHFAHRTRNSSLTPLSVSRRAHDGCRLTNGQPVRPLRPVVTARF